MTDGDLARARSGALAELMRMQRHDGAFQAYMARDAALSVKCVEDETPFVTSMTACSLQASGLSESTPFLAKALDYLEAQMEPPGVWRYWPRAHEPYRAIPPDLDDTCCCAYVLRRAGRAVPDSTSLVLANRDRRGRFYTWLVPRPQPTADLRYWRVTLRELRRLPSLLVLWCLTEASPNDVDGVVNVNVLRYLGARDDTGGAIRFIAEILEGERESTCDKWYQSAYSFYYAIANAYAGGVQALAAFRDTITDRIEKRASGTGVPGANPTENAMAVCALRHLGTASPVIAAAQSYLLQTQAPSGGWKGSAVYWGGPQRHFGWGSGALTTALCLEALS